MPQDWPMWLSIPVLSFGVLSFVAVWTIAIRGVIRELHRDPPVSAPRSAEADTPEFVIEREPRGE